MDLWIGLGSPARRLGSSQLSGPVLDSHSLVTSFPAPGFAFPKETYRSPPWLVFRGMFPKTHLLEAEIPSPGRHRAIPHLGTQGWSPPRSIPCPCWGFRIQSETMPVILVATHG